MVWLPGICWHRPWWQVYADASRFSSLGGLWGQFLFFQRVVTTKGRDTSGAHGITPGAINWHLGHKLQKFSTFLKTLGQKYWVRILNCILSFPRCPAHGVACARCSNWQRYTQGTNSCLFISCVCLSWSMQYHMSILRAKFGYCHAFRRTHLLVLYCGYLIEGSAPGLVVPLLYEEIQKSG